MSDTTDLPTPEVFEGVQIEEELQRSYIDYAMSVIVGRALPSVQDGLKPVHRRILYSMFEGGMRAGTPHRKCAAAVGDVMKKYHPHGDAPIYDALVRMGQPWAMRYPLIDGQGNFGSIDGDPPAAPRYTEARLSALAMEMIRDIDQETVDFQDNYDGHESEPLVLPSRFPNLLVNGSAGIAVGMATNVPPHNLVEMTNAVIAQIANPDITFEELLRIVPGPDFPTGALIVGSAGIRDAYLTGRGSIRMRAVIEVEEDAGRERLVVTEIPYQVNKANLAIKIAELVKDRRIVGISDLRDESNRKGIRLVIELKRDANRQVVLNQLYKMTQLQETFGVINLSLVDGVPRTLSLKDTIAHYIAHQVTIVTRRTAFRLRKAQDRIHVLDGYIIALDNLDAVIALIRAAESAEVARTQLMERFVLTEVQARAILEMQLRRLAGLERQAILDEHAELLGLITELEAILADPVRIREIIVTELTELRDKFGDARRSRIIPAEDEFDLEDLIPEEDMVITLTDAGYVKRVRADEYRLQKRGGRGIAGTALKDDDLVRDLFVTTTHHWLLFFTDRGLVHRVRAWQVPEKSRTARGTYVANVEGLELDRDEQIRAIVAVRDWADADDQYLVFATKQGVVKRTRLSAYDSPRTTLIAILLREADELIGVQVVRDDDDVILVSRRAKAVRFAISRVRSIGRNASGVRGMRLTGEDEVLSLAKVIPDGLLVVITDEGFGKRTPLEAFTAKGRGGQGVMAARLSEARGGLVGAFVARYEQEIMLITDTGTVIRMDVQDIRPTGRDSMGVRVMNTSQGARVAAVAPVYELNGHDDGDLADDAEGVDDVEGLDDAEGVDDTDGPSRLRDEADDAEEADEAPGRSPARAATSTTRTARSPSPASARAW